MRSYKTIGRTAAIVTLMGSTAAMADVTAEQVWDDVRGYYSSFGYEVTVGSESNAAGTLTLSDLGLLMETPEADITITLPELSFVENGDGTVSVEMPPEYPMHVAGKNEFGEEFDVRLNIAISDMHMVVSGDADKSKYVFSAADMALSVDEIIVDGDSIEGVIEVTGSGLAGSYDISKGSLIAMVTESTMDALDVNVDFADPEGQGAVKLAISYKDISSSSNGTYPEGANFEEFAAMIADGFSSTAMLTHNGSSWDIQGSGDGEEFALQASSSGVSVDFTMSQAGMGYGGAINDLALTVSGSEIPLPSVALSAAEYGFNFLMPVSKSDTPEDFSLLSKIIDLSVSDDIWGMIDPAGMLPRDPATLIVDLAGKGNWLVDIMDPENAAAMHGDEMPAELHALTLNQLKLSLAGAELNGSGDFTFDNSDLETFDGLPRPTGAIELTLDGANTLLDRLSDMGLLPKEQAMGARMMMGLFARPGEGEDSLTSKIEITEDGSISANGQRLR